MDGGGVEALLKVAGPAEQAGLQDGEFLADGADDADEGLDGAGEKKSWKEAMVFLADTGVGGVSRS